MAKISGNRLASVLALAAFLPPLYCAATSVGAEGMVESFGDDDVRLEGEEAKDSAGLAGCYDLTGIDTFELPYSGTLCISVLGKLLYELEWTLVEEDEGLVVYNGRGVSGGNDLFAVWRESGTEYSCYLHLFDIDSVDGTLQGLRVNVNGGTSSQTGTRDETEISLDWSEAGQLAGSYDLESSDGFNGKRLEVAHLPIAGDDAYTFRWIGDTELEGIGVREGNSISVVANPVGQRGGTCGSITFTRVDDTRELKGSFFTLDSLSGKAPRRRGEETATPRD
jgi:hypothetical protein